MTAEVTDPDGNPARRNRFLRRAAIATLAMRALSIVALLGVTPLLARQLGVEMYGVVATLTSTAVILGIADFGIANGLITKIATAGWSSPRTASLLSAAGVILVTASLLGVCAAMALSWLLPWPRWLNAPTIASSDLRWATLYALLGGALTLTTSLGQKIDLARQRGHAVAIWGAAAVVAGPVGGLVVALVRPDLPIVVAAVALMPPIVLGCQTAVGIRSLPPELRPRRHLAKRTDIVESIRSGGVFLGLAIVIAVSFQMDALIVSSALGAAVAAQFNVVVRLFGLVGDTIRSALTQLWSAFADALARGEISWVKRTLARTTIGGGAAALVANLGVVLVGQRLVAIWLGPGFRPTLGLLIAAGLWSAYSTAAHPLAMFLNGSQMQGTELVAAIPMAVANLALSLYLVRHIGASGPLIGSLMAHVVCAGVPLGIVAIRRIRALELSSPMDRAAAMDPAL